MTGESPLGSDLAVDLGWDSVCKPLALLCVALAFFEGVLGLPPRAAAGASQPPTPDPRFGIVESYVNSRAATEAGAGYTRIILRWDVVQPDGPLDWKPANVPDPLIASELAAGRQVVGLLIGTPAWAAVDPSQGARSVPKMEYWAAFVRGMAQQYRGRITHWVIWNEPDVWALDNPGSTWAGTEADYFDLLKTAYLAIKSVDPTLSVNMAGLTYFWDWSHGRRQYLDRLLDVVAADPTAAAHNFYFDAVTYHLYYKPLQAPAVIADVQGILQRHGIQGKQIWINETNAPPSDDAQEMPWSAPRYAISLQEQAAFVIQEFALAFAAGASRVEFYKLRNSADHPESIEPYGLLRADDSRRPAFAAYQAVTTYLGGFRSARLEQMGEVYAVTFDRGGQTTTVIWTIGREAQQVRVKAIAAQANLVDEAGHATLLPASEGSYSIQLPGATCTQVSECLVGGAPRMLVEAGGPAGRAALMALEPPTLTATGTVTASLTAGGPVRPTLPASPGPTAVAAPGSTSEPASASAGTPMPMLSGYSSIVTTGVPALQPRETPRPLPALAATVVIKAANLTPRPAGRRSTDAPTFAPAARHGGPWPAGLDAITARRSGQALPATASPAPAASRPGLPTGPHLWGTAGPIWIGTLGALALAAFALRRRR